MKFICFFFLFLTVSIGLGIGYVLITKNDQTGSQSVQTIDRDSSVPWSLANGQRQYHLRGCVKCHGILGDGKGTRAARYDFDPPPRDFQNLSGYSQGRRLEEIVFTLRNGIKDKPKSLMPKYPFLADEEIRHIAQYVVYLQTNQRSF